MPSLGGWEIVIILAVLLLLFGAKKLPDMARSIGQSARVFKGEMKGMRDDEQPKAGQTPAEQQPSQELSPGAVLNQPTSPNQPTQQQAAPQQAAPQQAAPQPQQSRSDVT